MNQRRVAKLIDLGYGSNKLVMPSPALPPAVPALLTIEQTAQQLGVGAAAVRHWITAGLLYSVGLGPTGRVRRIPAGEIERMRNLGNGTTGQVQG